MVGQRPDMPGQNFVRRRGNELLGKPAMNKKEENRSQVVSTAKTQMG